MGQIKTFNRGFIVYFSNRIIIEHHASMTMLYIDISIKAFQIPSIFPKNRQNFDGNLSILTILIRFRI